ncbi:MAG: acyl-ACP--UDP-N-acetylglucosamine O-acyltransferase [Phycisphaerales bacterium]
MVRALVTNAQGSSFNFSDAVVPPDLRLIMITIHPTAIVDPTAEIGENVEIGPYCVIGAYVEIGAGSKLHNHVTIEGPTTLGRDNEVYPFSVIGADPQDLKFRGEQAVCIVGDRNIIREHVTIHRGTQNGGGFTRVGNDNLFMVAAHVAHDCIVGSNCVIANQVMIGGHAVIDDMVTIGGGAGIHHFATVGRLSFIGGLARIKKDVPPYMIVEGDPAEVRGLNTIGLTRRNFDNREIAALREAYKRLFRTNNGAARAMKNTMDELLDDYGAIPAVVHLCECLRKSANGVRGRSAESYREDSKYATQPK